MPRRAAAPPRPCPPRRSRRRPSRPSPRRRSQPASRARAPDPRSSHPSRSSPSLTGGASAGRATSVTPVFNLNYVRTEENGAVNIGPRRATVSVDRNIAAQALFGDLKLADVGPYLDTLNLRTGVQGFTSDFRGFVFSDFDPGVKLSGNYAANRTQWNLAYFRPLEKDTNSGLNTVFSDRAQDVVVANLTRQDLIWPGYAGQASVQYSADQKSRHFDENGFLVRPANIGDSAPHEIRVGYLGWTGEGHIQRFGVSHAFFEAIGRDSHNPIARRGQDINAQMAALEVSYDRDWLRFKSYVLW